MKSQNDSEHIDQVLCGDNRAYAALVDKYKAMAFTVAYRVLRNREDAEETAMDAFLKAYDSLPQFQKDASFSTWLYRIVFNTAVSRLRTRSPDFVSVDNRDMEKIDFEKTNEGLSRLLDEERKRFVGEAIGRLGELDSVIITLFYIDGKSVDDIAGITGQSRSNVKVRLFRGRSKLFAELHKILKSEAKDLTF